MAQRPREPHIPDPPPRPDLNRVTIHKDRLLAKVRENQSAHEAIFNEAMEAYIAEYKKRLREMLAEAEDENVKIKELPQYVNRPVPESHVKDYERVIQMLEFSVDTQFDLTLQEFNQYIMDDWSWKQTFLATTSSYTSGGKFPS